MAEANISAVEEVKISLNRKSNFVSLCFL